ncbi:YraN family protein [Candidatus Gracilibacteria bacterium]|nr:YraN family protein [Candidatus Gracilibacteria bacterium]
MTQYKPQNSQRSIGTTGESIACRYLIESGYTILQRNYQLKGGEIDIIAQDGKWTVFVEVKYRRDELYAHPLDTFTRPKRRALFRTSSFYREKHRIDPDTIRYDFIGIMPKKDGTIGHRLWHVEGVEI